MTPSVARHHPEDPDECRGTFVIIKTQKLIIHSYANFFNFVTNVKRKLSKAQIRVFVFGVIKKFLTVLMNHTIYVRNVQKVMLKF